MVCPSSDTYYTIPSRVLFCVWIDLGAKLLFAFLTEYLTESADTTNKELMEIFKVSRRTIQRWIKQLANQGFIQVQVEVSKEFAQVTRYIKIGRDL